MFEKKKVGYSTPEKSVAKKDIHPFERTQKEIQESYWHSVCEGNAQSVQKADNATQTTVANRGMKPMLKSNMRPAWPVRTTHLLMDKKWRALRMPPTQRPKIHEKTLSRAEPMAKSVVGNLFAYTPKAKRIGSCRRESQTWSKVRVETMTRHTRRESDLFAENEKNRIRQIQRIADLKWREEEDDRETHLDWVVGSG